MSGSITYLTSSPWQASLRVIGTLALALAVDLYEKALLPAAPLRAVVRGEDAVGPPGRRPSRDGGGVGLGDSNFKLKSLSKTNPMPGPCPSICLVVLGLVHFSRRVSGSLSVGLVHFDFPGGERTADEYGEEIFFAFCVFESCIVCGRLSEAAACVHSLIFASSCTSPLAASLSHRDAGRSGPARASGDGAAASMSMLVMLGLDVLDVLNG